MLKQTIAIFIGSLGLGSAMQDAGLGNYMQYLAKQGKSYHNLGEFTHRLSNFNEIDAWIQDFNADPQQTSTVGHN